MLNTKACMSPTCLIVVAYLHYYYLLVSCWLVAVLTARAARSSRAGRARSAASSASRPCGHALHWVYLIKSTKSWSGPFADYISLTQCSGSGSRGQDQRRRGTDGNSIPRPLYITMYLLTICNHFPLVYYPLLVWFKKVGQSCCQAFNPCRYNKHNKYTYTCVMPRIVCVSRHIGDFIIVTFI